jgi:hypothetical protein
LTADNELQASDDGLNGTTSANNDACSQFDVAASTRLDHSYGFKSQVELTAQVNSLTQKLKAKIVQLRNARRRESRLRGSVGDMLQRLKNMQLLSKKAEELVKVYQHISINLLSGKNGRKFNEEQKQFAITLQ